MNFDLHLYGFSTKRLNEQIKRNRERFPEDFRFQLTLAEKRSEFEVLAQSPNAFDDIRQLMSPPEPKRKQIAFRSRINDESVSKRRSEVPRVVI